MQQNLDQQISQLIDNELDYDDAIRLLKKIKKQDALSQRMARYEAINHSLKEESFFSADAGFAGRVSQAIDKEPAYFLPQKKQHFSWQKSMVALAATVAIVAILLTRGGGIEQQQIESALVVAEKTEQPQHMQQPEQRKEPFNKRFNEYLQAHSDSLYTNGEVAPMPYARLAGYAQE